MEMFIFAVLLGIVGGVAQIAAECRNRIQPRALEATPVLQPLKQETASEMDYFPELTAWDRAISGATPEPTGVDQYADRPLPEPAPVEASGPVQQSFGHMGMDLPPSITSFTAKGITTDYYHLKQHFEDLQRAKKELEAGFTKPDQDKVLQKFEDTRETRAVQCDTYVRSSPYRKSEYVRIATAGMRERIIGYVHGEYFSVAGNSTDIWFVLGDESVIWSGYFAYRSTVGLYPYDVDEPEVCEQKTFSGKVVARTTTYPFVYPSVRKPYAA